MSLKDEFYEFCDVQLALYEPHVDAIWEWITDKVGETQEKLLNDVQAARDQMVAMEARLRVAQERERLALNELQRIRDGSD